MTLTLITMLQWKISMGQIDNHLSEISTNNKRKQIIEKSKITKNESWQKVRQSIYA